MTRERLLLHLWREDGTDALWVPLDQTGRPLGSVQRGPLSRAAGMATDRFVIVLVPAERLLLTHVSLPGVRGARLRQAIPFALEERLVGEVEDQHFAIGQVDGEGKVAVAVVEDARMSRWMSSLAEAGIVPASCLPDVLALPLPGDTPTAVTCGERVLVRTTRDSGFACVEGALAQLSPDSAPPLRMNMEALLPMLAPQLDHVTVDLMQGRYAPRRRVGGDPSRWRIPVALAAAWLLVLLMGWASEYRSAAVQQRALQSDIRAVFEAALPGEPMVDPRLQFERRAGVRSGQSGEWLAMLTAAADSMVTAAGMELASVNYRPGVLELSVVAQRAEQVEDLRTRIAAAGSFQASIESASSRGDRVEGRIVLRPGRR